MKTLLLFIVNLLSISLYSQIPKANFHSEEHLYYNFRGQVQSCEIRNFDEKGNYHWSILNNTNQDLHYDKEGKLMERITYNIGDFLYSDSIFTETKWTYRYEKNKLKNVNKIDLGSNTTEDSWEYQYSGDSVTFKVFLKNGKDTINITKAKTVNNQIFNYKTNNKGHFYLSKIKEFEENKIKSASSFDKKEQLKFLMIYNYDYDSLGNEIVIDHQIAIKRKMVHKTISTKNQYGDIVTKLYLNEKDELLAESIYQYEYDEHSNWVKKTAKWRNDRTQEYIKHVSTRKITYY